MLSSLPHLLVSIPALALQLLVALPAEGWRCLWKRLPLFLLVWCAHCLLTLLHIIGHLLDEVFFFSWHRVRVKQPIFILGLPRSGTTFLQRLLSNDDRLTTFTTWEAILAPSLTEKYLYLGLGLLLLPLGRLAGKIRGLVFKRMDSIHVIRLSDPEEDFLLLVPMQACMLMAFLMPESPHYWRLGRFDDAFSPVFRQRVLDYYHGCLKKHLYFHGSDKRLLSKNPSFTSWIHSLLDNFPDAGIVACTRPPAEVLPSQLSSLRPAMQILGQAGLTPESQHKMIEVLHHYYFLLGRLSQEPGIVFLPMSQLRTGLKSVVISLYRFLNLHCSDHMNQVLDKAEGRSRTYSSGHHYSLKEFSLTGQDVEEKFRDVWPLSLERTTERAPGAEDGVS